MYVQVKRLLYNGTVIGFLCHIELQSTCDQMVLTDISNCVLNVLYVRNIALNKVNYSHSSWAFNPPPTNKKAHRKKTKHLYIYFSVEEILELMNMNKKSQTLIWREKNKTAQSRSNGFGLLGCLALTSTPGQETFISNSRNDDSKQSPCFLNEMHNPRARDSSSPGGRLQ